VDRTGVYSETSRLIAGLTVKLALAHIRTDFTRRFPLIVSEEAFERAFEKIASPTSSAKTGRAKSS
jgi:hypothetical protein